MPAKKRVYARKPRSYAARYMPSSSTRYAVPEKKCVDVASATYLCDTTGSVTALNLIDEGTTESSRIGRRVQIKSVQLRGMVDPVDGSTSACFARVMLIWDKQVNGVIATIAQILSAATSNSFMNLDNRERFVVLMDKPFAVGAFSNVATTAYAQSPTVHAVNEYKQLPANSYTIYDGTGSGIGDINTGALYLVTIGNQAAGAGARLVATTRVRYTDL